MQLIFDLTLLAGWTRAVVGTTRVEREIALRAAALFPEQSLVFAVQEPGTGTILALPRAVADAILNGTVRIKQGDAGVAPKRSLIRRVRRKARAFLKRSAAAIGASFGRTALGSAASDDSDRNRPEATAGRALRSLRGLGARPLMAEQGSVLISVGLGSSEWLASVRGLRQAGGARYVAYCHDLIPAKFPHLVPADYLPQRERYLADLFRTADLVLLHSEAVRTDAISYCAAQGISPPAFTIVPPGSDLPPGEERPSPRLAPGRFVLYVAALEPRKNHRYLYELWRELRLDRAIAEDFKLVLVGELYPNVAETIDLLRRDSVVCDSVVMMSGVSDAELRWLYRNARMFVHPSLAEGYAIPVAEALGHGTAGICSDDPAMRENFGHCIPAIPLSNRDQWKDRIAVLCRDDDALRAAQERARAVVPRSWDECARDLFAAVKSFGTSDPRRQTP